ncbi:cyclopropane fatty acid synthase [Sistotremastrum niveocremeum HHB9708]|uniref:Cyclopropane fatty acid synthase n=1 Tax=Sistotremastrum niveocremeum HHB9708 TaxID=1314777 RepID=A0A164S4T2_9AGAM|nr:cyclopropane fatty acid synthase [Sistotremastrum niveocremeum HHB9708]
MVRRTLHKGIVTGRLEIFDPVVGKCTFGADHANGDAKEPQTAIVYINDENFWVRVLLSYDVGFSEAYMAGEFDSPDLKSVLDLYVDNLDHLGALSSPIYWLIQLHAVVWTFLFNHRKSKAVENAAVYNASNELYRAFLSDEMMYSCPLWSEEEGGIRGDMEGKRAPGDLEAAQARKIAHLLDKAGVRAGDRVMDIGCGWGALAIGISLKCQAARRGCTVDAITVSVEQAKGARERVKLAGFEDKVRIHCMDYRDMPPHFEKAFDACFSTEMLEAVGVKHMKKYLRLIDWALKDDRSSVVLTASTYPERTYTPYQGNDFVRKYHWPNGVSPSPTSFLNDFQKHVPGRFCVVSVEDMSPHYPRGLREWGRRFEENWDEKLVRSLEERYPELKQKENMEIFRRKWRYMFLYMEIAYSRWWLGLTCWTLTRHVSGGYLS